MKIFNPKTSLEVSRNIVVQDSLNQIMGVRTMIANSLIQKTKFDSDTYAIDPEITYYISEKKCRPEVREALLNNPEIIEYLRGIYTEMNEARLSDLESFDQKAIDCIALIRASFPLRIEE